jgi:glycosyltransferase involved in cell wall biosynthesis
MRKRKLISVSVIIPTYNRRDYIVDAVKSVLAQNIDDLEIIVVDDGSTDDTRYVLEPYKDAIRYYYQVNQGVSAARNRGIRECRGELLAFLDSDDLWSTGKLRAQIDRIYREDILSFEGVEWFVDQKEDRKYLHECSGVKWPRCDSAGYVIDPVLDVAEGHYFHLGTMLCRKDTFLKVGFFDEGLCMGEDEDWFSRASLGIRFHYIPEPFLKRRFHANQTASDREECIRSLVKVFSNIKTRSENVHQEAYVAANKRLAAKWSHLANCLSYQGRRLEAGSAAWAAFSLEPLNMQRLLKAGLMLAGWRPGKGAFQRYETKGEARRRILN